MSPNRREELEGMRERLVGVASQLYNGTRRHYQTFRQHVVEAKEGGYRYFHTYYSIYEVPSWIPPGVNYQNWMDMISETRLPFSPSDLRDMGIPFGGQPLRVDEGIRELLDVINETPLRVDEGVQEVEEATIFRLDGPEALERMEQG